VNAFEETLNRVVARHTRRALATRTSRGLSPDPAITIGIATIKIVTEEHIQAVAFGALDCDPQIVLRLDPMGRDVSDLRPFADFLNTIVDRALATASAMRIWIPHGVTLEALDVLGHRYWRNENAPDEIQRMGKTCRIIAHESMIPGQQLVADATALLQDHCITGMAPIEEGHLDAILAWFDRAVTDPLTESRERIRLPASGILPNTPDHPIDDRIDRLRKEAKNATGARLRAIQAQIADTLRHWILREWDLLVEGRRAFLGLGLSATSLNGLVEDSAKRVAYDLQNGFYPARAPHRLAAELGTLEAGRDKAELAALENDPALREQAMRAGGVVLGTVTNVGQGRRNIDVDSDQNVIRLRRDDKIKIAGYRVHGVVRALSATAGGGTRISIEIINGVRQTGVLSIGARVELLRDAYGFVNHRALKETRERQPWIFYGDAAPTISPGRSTGQSALAIARAARR
jgi:hypothetical protein